MQSDYFQTVDTVEKAYWLGFLMGDCGISPHQTITTLTLSTKDEEQIIQFCEVIGINPAERKHFPAYPQHHRGPSVGITISDPIFTSHLTRLGCVYKKSLILEYPMISPEFNLPFVLGVYDADGWEGCTTLGSGSLQFLEQLKECNHIPYEVRSAPTQYIISLGTDFWRRMIKSYSGGLQRKRYLSWGTASCPEEFMRTDKRIGPKPHKRKFNPTSDELSRLVWQMPSTHVAEYYGVSGKAIQKRCQLLGIPKPPRGYWSKQTTRTKLSKN